MFLPAFIPFELPDPAVTEAAGYNLRLGWRAVHPDLRSRDGYRYPFPGQWADAGGPILGHTDACPRAAGDGLCVAKTWRGAASGGIPATTVLLVGYDQADVYGEDDNKVRVGAMLVLDVVDVAAMARRGHLGGANLGGADLGGADLWGADLWGADLGGANLGGANLRVADLRVANLGGANLGGANLGGADLWGADLGGADLGGANLGGADLGGANLGGANLGGANLGGANLGGANLGSANLGGANLRVARSNRFTVWPTGFNPAARGVVVS